MADFKVIEDSAGRGRPEDRSVGSFEGRGKPLDRLPVSSISSSEHRKKAPCLAQADKGMIVFSTKLVILASSKSIMSLRSVSRELGGKL